MALARRPICPKCHKPMQYALVKRGRDRQFTCLDCEGEDPLVPPEVTKLLTALRPLPQPIWSARRDTFTSNAPRNKWIEQRINTPLGKKLMTGQILQTGRED
jgi:hypothetical protein